MRSPRVPDNAQVVFNDDGRLHFAALEPEPEPEPEPASLLELRAAVNAMLPRVDLPEVLLEVFSWTGADQAFTSVTGGEARLKDLHVTIAALLVAHGCNVGYTPVLGGVDALKYGRLSHVDHTYLRLATYRAANAALIEHQASICLAQAWGGGLVASVDGMRFVVPVPSVYARPNPKYFGRRGGATWLNMINDQAAGLGAYDVIRMLSRDGRPTPLGDAIAHYGRIAKTLHILRLADEPGYRRQIKVQANLQEGRHALARKIFHGRAGQLYQRYQDGMEDQIGALGLVLNALVLFNTRYLDAVTQLRADGFDVHDEDIARLSPFVRHHINMLGRYSFQLPDLPGGLRPLRDKDAADNE